MPHQESKEGKLGLSGEDVLHKDEGPGIQKLFAAMGDSEADPAALAASEDGKLISQRMELMTLAEGSPEDLAYWAGYEKGLRKAVYGTGREKWASYIPLAAERQPQRKFPLIFCLHGAHNPIKLTESYGVMQVAAREECLFRTVACEKMVHSATVMFAELVWEHIGKFARDPKTGNLIKL